MADFTAVLYSCQQRDSLTVGFKNSLSLARHAHAFGAYQRIQGYNSEPIAIGHSKFAELV